MANTSLIAFGIFSCWGILGLQILSGKLRFCSDPTVIIALQCQVR